MSVKVDHRVFQEGHTYPFTIYNRIEITGIEYFVLIDSQEKKHLLEAAHYTHYGFETGQQIMCRIDKINCTGKIYLEPINPFYTVGKSFKFTIKDEVSLINSFGENERHLIVSDLFGKYHQLWIPSNGLVFEKGDSIELYVVQIRKGNLFMVHPLFYISENGYQTDRDYRFTIEGISTLTGEKEYYRLKDEFGQVHFLRSKFFINYNFKKGTTFNGRIVKKPRTGSYYIEPHYPEYEIGKSYQFTFQKEDVYFHPSGKEEDVWVVRDKNDKKCYLFFSVEPSSESKSKPIRAKVENVYKGKLFLRWQA
jgi:hypothetical protein